jgi:hypothetical protein
MNAKLTLLVSVFVLILVLATCGTRVSDGPGSLNVSRSGPVSQAPNIAHIYAVVHTDNGTWRPL